MSKQQPLTTRWSGVLKELSAAEATNLDERGIPKKLGEQFRRVQVDSDAYNADDHTVTMAVSSETPVDRYYGNEVLSHAPGAMRTNRLKSGVSLLFNHDYDKQLGRSKSYKLRDDKVLEVTSRFGPSPLATEKEADVAAGILVDVSIGYLVHEWEITEDKNGVRTYLAVDWELLEVSLVTVPADPTVGVGRGAEEQPVKVRSFRTMADEELPVDDEAARAAKAAKTGDADDDEDDDDEDDDPDAGDDRSAAPISAPPTPATQRTPVMAEQTVDLAAQETARKEGLRTLHTQYPEQFNQRKLESAIALDVPVERAKTAIFDSIVAASERTQVETASDEVFGDLSERELAQYSLRDAYRAAVNLARPGSYRSEKGDKYGDGSFARTVGEAIRVKAEERGATGLGSGITIPSFTNKRLFNAQQQRALASGGNAGTETNVVIVEADPIELLRARTACLALGTRMMTGLFGTIKMPRQSAAGTSNWLTEGSAASETDPALDAITLAPSRLSMWNAYYRDLLAQSRLAVDSFLANDRLQVLSRSLDSAGLAGSGTAPVPQGVLNFSGLAAIISGTTRAANGTVTAGAGGVPMTYVDYNNLEAAISTANADIGTIGIVTTPKVRAAGRSTPQIPGTASGFVWPNSKVGPNGVQEGPLGYNAIATSNAVLTGFTANSVAGCHAVIMGVWDQLLMGDWGLSELIVDPYTGASEALVNITEHAYYGIACRHIPAFAACTTVLPS